MLGFIIGAACVVGIAKMLRRRAWYARFGYGGGPHECASPMGYRGLGRRGPRSAGGRWALRSVFERLETTPGQERVIVAALDELRENRKALRDEAKQTRARPGPRRSREASSKTRRSRRRSLAMIGRSRSFASASPRP